MTIRTPIACPALLVGLLLASGCAPDRDPVTTNHTLESGDETATVHWSDADRNEAIEAMRAALAGTAAVRPAPAENGVRWSDIPNAVVWGASELEIAVLRVSERSDTRIVFELQSAADEPATLIVERVDSPERIRLTASVGTFSQRTATARALEASVRRYLEEFGKKPGFE